MVWQQAVTDKDRSLQGQLKELASLTLLLCCFMVLIMLDSKTTPTGRKITKAEYPDATQRQPSADAAHLPAPLFDGLSR